MKNKKNKSFDCIAMKRSAQEIIRMEVKDMTLTEEIAYFRESAKDFERKLQAAKQQELTHPNPASSS
ncbi:MAG: hypothetical protein ABSA77_09455 [Thermoguttaceae bacterium]|jgi:hypothetical protein